MEEPPPKLLTTPDDTVVSEANVIQNCDVVTIETSLDKMENSSSEKPYECTTSNLKNAGSIIDPSNLSSTDQSEAVNAGASGNATALVTDTDIPESDIVKIIVVKSPPDIIGITKSTPPVEVTPQPEDFLAKAFSNSESNSNTAESQTDTCKSKENVNNRSQSNDNNFNLIGGLSTEELMKVYDEKENANRDCSSPNSDSNLIKVLANLQGSEIELKSLENVSSNNNSEPKTTADLLAILEGDCDEPSSLNLDKSSSSTLSNSKNKVNGEVENESELKKVKKRQRALILDPEVEKKLALQQLKELPVGKRKSPKTLNKILDVKIPSIKPPVNIKRYIIETADLPEKIDENSTPNEISISKKNDKSDSKSHKKKSVQGDISFLDDDWSDDEVSDKNHRKKSDSIDPSCIKLVAVENGKQSDSANKSIESKSHDEGLASRRVSRVIKKKIIWDPDNPASYSFASSSVKKKSDKDHDVISSETQESYKKPKTVQSKITKHLYSIPEKKDPLKNDDTPAKPDNILITPGKKKKMTEVDKLLMDEGAVNMIYQLERSNNNVNVPEIILKPNKKSMISISREKRNLLNKAKIIKDAVFNVANPSNASNEVKTFRVRKSLKMQKKENMRDSMQSPMPSEVSVNDSIADESRIIRRHSSSSFSSGCLSPRPQSPSESFNFNISKPGDTPIILLNNCLSDNETLKNQRGNALSNTNKSLKRKYNTPAKVNALKLRKNSSSEEMPTNKSTPQNNMLKIKNDSYTQLTLQCFDNIAHIIVNPSNNSECLFDTKVLEELSVAVLAANNANVQVLVLTSDDGVLCGGLDLRCILQTRLNVQRTNSSHLVENLREFIVQLKQFKGAVILGVDGACQGFGVALLSIADIVLASDRATFCISPTSRRELPPECTSLLTLNHFISPQLSRELILCGRKLTASEALQRGMIARTLWPDRFLEELLTVAKDIAQYPIKAFNITKSIWRNGENALVDVLQEETTLLADFWCSPSGQDAIRNTHSPL